MRLREEKQLARDVWLGRWYQGESQWSSGNGGSLMLGRTPPEDPSLPSFCLCFPAFSRGTCSAELGCGPQGGWGREVCPCPQEPWQVALFAGHVLPSHLLPQSLPLPAFPARPRPPSPSIPRCSVAPGSWPIPPPSYPLLRSRPRAAFF